MTILEKVESWCFPECHFINHFIVQDVRKVTIPPAWALVFWTRLKLTRITSGRSHLTPPWPETPTEQPVTRATLRRPVTGSRHSISKARRRSARKICKRPSNTVWKVRLKARWGVRVAYIFSSVVSACELGNLGGCVNVSIMYSKGEGTDKNPVAAKVGTEISLLTSHCFTPWCRSTGTLPPRWWTSSKISRELPSRREPSNLRCCSISRR